MRPEHALFALVWLTGCSAPPATVMSFDEIVSKGDVVEGRRADRQVVVSGSARTTGFLHETRTGYRLYRDRSSAENAVDPSGSIAVIGVQGQWPPVYSMRCFEDVVSIKAGWCGTRSKACCSRE